MPRRILPSVVLASVSAASIACGGSMNEPGNHGPPPYTDTPAPANGVAQFTVLPVAIAPGLSVAALGNLNPPGHVLPTDHAYFYDGDLSASRPFGTDVRPVYMPATGAVFFVLHQSGAEYKIMFRATSTFYFYFDHLVPTTPPNVGDVIQAGTQIGTTTMGAALDFGAFDQSATHTGFLNAARYPVQTQWYVSPWKYFTPELQALIVPHLFRAPSADKLDAKIDFSVPGKLVGDWFLQAMPVDSSAYPYGWSRTISFAYDYYDPTQVRISIGGTIGAAGVWAIDSTAPRPETVTVGSGLVRYKLYSQFDPGFPPVGVLLAQMTNDSTIKVELFTGSAASATQFDGREITFVR